MSFQFSHQKQNKDTQGVGNDKQAGGEGVR